MNDNMSSRIIFKRTEPCHSVSCVHVWEFRIFYEEFSVERGRLKAFFGKLPADAGLELIYERYYISGDVRSKPEVT